MAVPQETLIRSFVIGDELRICAYEPVTKQQFTVWVFESEPNPKKVVCRKTTSKQMVACFFCKTGHVATVPLERRRTVNSDWYTTFCLPKVFEETNKRGQIIVHHGNASFRTSAEISELLTG